MEEGTSSRQDGVGRVSPGQQAEEALDRLAELLRDAPLNLVAASQRPTLRSTHVEECRLVGECLVLEPGATWVDLGTGGGLPGLVLAVLHPAVRWLLIDAAGKKVAAVSGFARELALANVEVRHGRAEELARDPGLRGRCDGVVCRALAVLPVAVELGRAFLRPGGTMAVVKGPGVGPELEALRRAAGALRVFAIHRQEVAAATRPTVLVTMRAQGSPPPGVPRPTGIPTRHPLGGTR